MRIVLLVLAGLSGANAQERIVPYSAPLSPIPPRCIQQRPYNGHIEREVITALLSAPNSLNQLPRLRVRGGWGGETPNGLSIAQAEPFCEDVLFQNVQTSIAHYFLDRTREQPLRYRSSVPRSYCGITAESEGCPYESPWPTGIVLPTDFPAAEAPVELEPALRALQQLGSASQPREAWISDATARNVRVWSTARPQSPPPPRWHFAPLTHGEYDPSITILRSGYVSYVELFPSRWEREQPQRSTNNLREQTQESFDTQLDALITQFLERQFPLRTLFQRAPDPNALGVRAAEIFVSRAADLRAYWQLGAQLLDRDVTIADVSSAFQRLQGSPEQAAFLRDTLQRDADIRYLLDSTLATAARAMNRASSHDELMSAAAAWWSARSLQIRASCDPQSNLPTTSQNDITQMLRAQVSHQNCRRSFMSWAYFQLNHEIRRSGELRLDQRSWRTAYVLSSRKERADLIRDSLSVLSQRVRTGLRGQGRLPSRSELGILALNTLQNQEEQRRASVTPQQAILTWNGFQPLASDDLAMLQSEQAGLAQFWQETAARLRPNACQFPAFAQALKQSLTLLGLSHSLPGECATSYLAALATSNALSVSPNRSEDLAVAFQEGLEIARRNPEARSGLCESWRQILVRVPRSEISDAITLDRQRATPEDLCLFTTQLWIKDLVSGRLTSERLDPSLWRTQCEQLDANSCLAHATFTGTPAAWGWALSQNPHPPRVARLLFSALNASVQAARAQPRQRLSRAWQLALLRIHRAEHGWLAAQERAFELPRQSARWQAVLENLNRLGVATSRLPWTDTLLSAELRMLYWEQRLAPWSRVLASRARSFTIDNAFDQARQYCRRIPDHLTEFGCPLLQDALRARAWCEDPSWISLSSGSCNVPDRLEAPLVLDRL